MDADLNARFRLTLADVDAGGGSGGGGNTTSETTTGAGPLPGQRARTDLYNRIEPDSAPSDSGETNQTPDTEPAEGEPDSPPSEETDSAPAQTTEQEPGEPAQKGKQPKRDQRVSEAQRALHQTREEARLAREEAEKLKADLALAQKYVDFDKLRDYDKEQSTKDLDKPLTKRDLQELQKPQPRETDTTAKEEAERQKYLEGYVKKHPHMDHYLSSKEAYGVFLKTAEELGPEASLDEIGDAVADYFKKVDTERERKVAERITKQRRNITSGDVPRSVGTPKAGDEPEVVTDRPEDYVAERMARRARVTRPQT